MDNSRHGLAPLAGIVLFAFVLRMDAIGSRLHVDDAYTWLVVSQPSAHAFLRQLAATENTPPLSYLLLTPLPVNDPVWLRLPAAVAGTLMCVATYWVTRELLRPLEGAMARWVPMAPGPGAAHAAALLAALAVAVDPFLITDSDLARGFMLKDLALLVALAAILRLARAKSRSWRWSAACVCAGAVALYTEYSAAIFFAAVLVAAGVTRAMSRRRMAAPAAVAFASLLPWISQIARAERQVGVTKLHPAFATPSLTQLRDLVLTLTFGENGGAASGAARWLLFCAVLVAAGLAVVVIRTRWQEWDARVRQAVALLALAGGLTLAGHALAALVGIDVFTQRYTTILVPVGATLAAVALAAAGRPALLTIATVGLVCLGAVELVRRYRGEYEPSLAPVRQAALALRPRTVLTDSPLVVYYLRTLHPVLDRPSNLGSGLAASCLRPCLIVDDTRVYSGTPRTVSGARRMIGPYVLTLER
jgi:lipoprotein signal peptidase